MMRFTAGAAVLVLMLTACDAALEDTTLPVPTTSGRATTTSVATADWLIAYEGPPTTSMAVGVRGTLIIDVANECVQIRSDSDQTVYTVVWPRGTVLELDGDQPTVVSPDGEYTDGATIELNGGATPLDDGGHPPYRGCDSIVIPAQCRTDYVWLAATH